MMLPSRFHLVTDFTVTVALYLGLIVRVSRNYTRKPCVAGVTFMILFLIPMPTKWQRKVVVLSCCLTSTVMRVTFSM